MEFHAADGPATAEDATSIKEDAFDPLKVGLTLLSQLPAGDNAIISPQSIATVLAMLYSGARGDTRRELESVLHMSANAVDDFVASLGQLANSTTSDGTRLRSSTTAYTANDLAVESEYRQSLVRLAASIAHLDFVKDPEAAREHINRLVAAETAGLIKNLLPSGAIASNTSLVLVNAMYFKGLWKEPFDAEQTRDADFQVGTGKTVAANMMSLSSDFRYAVDEKRRLQLLLLPYAAVSQLSMLLLLPFEGVPLEEALGQVNGSGLASAVAGMHSVKVDVVLPRFSVSSFVDVKSGLSALGLRSLFGSSSDLSGICSTRKLVVSSCLHRAVIDVSEEGTEAAAATAAMVATYCMVWPERFVCDRPFAFAIWHEATATALFFGCIRDPTQRSEK